MMRNLMVLVGAGVLAIGLSFSRFAGSVLDADSDGIPDQYDNCTGLPNGPAAAAGFGQCDWQMDADLDGYGNACDFDVSQDGKTLPDDIGATLTNFNGVEPLVDWTCDGKVLPDDIGGVLVNFNGNPGPSGLACADPTGATAPCVAQ